MRCRRHFTRAAGMAFCLVMLSAAVSCQTRLPTVTLGVAGQDLTVEIARTEAQREHGLMGRTGLGPREGMIFVFDRDEHLTFWMKDTPSALTIAFLSAEGKILQLEDMEPYSEKIVRSSFSARYALEMRKGAFSDLGISEGMTVSFPAGFPDKP